MGSQRAGRARVVGHLLKHYYGPACVRGLVPIARKLQLELKQKQLLAPADLVPQVILEAPAFFASHGFLVTSRSARLVPRQAGSGKGRVWQNQV